MAIDRKEPDEGFIGRWSRMKTEARDAPPVATEQPPAGAVDPHDAPPELPPIETLTFDSDFKGFFHPKVDENMRRAALRKLFSDPHFNVMDGLDVYIDDYSKSEPIPAAMLASLKQAQRIIEWANEKNDAGDAKQLETDAENAAAPDLAVAPALENTASELPTVPANQPVPVDKPEVGS